MSRVDLRDVSRKARRIFFQDFSESASWTAFWMNHWFYGDAMMTSTEMIKIDGTQNSDEVLSFQVLPIKSEWNNADQVIWFV